MSNGSNSNTACTTLVCGHIDLTKEQYDIHYRQHVSDILNNGGKIITGAASGTDSHTIEQCISEGKAAQLTVYDKNFNLEMSRKVPNYISGYESYTARDAAMVDAADFVYARLYDNSMSFGSGSFRNVLHKAYGRNFADTFMGLARKESFNPDAHEVCRKLRDIYLVVKK